MRLIDANLAMRKIREYMEDYPNATARLAACRACLSILGDKQQVPTIDPESLRPRGTWEGTADGYANGELVYDTWTCSECGYTVDTDDPDDLTKFCPNCGAKMEGGKTVKCKDCACYKDEWCEKIADSPDEEMERECEHFVQRKGDGRSVTVTRAQAETMRREWKVGMADSFGALIHCSECGNGTNFGNVKKWMEDERHQFCGVCGAPMSDKAMDRLWKRLEDAMNETETD